MNTSISQTTPSQFDIVLGSYLLEAERLAHTFESKVFDRLQPRFEDYESFIKSINKQKTHKLVRSSTNKNIVLDIKKHSKAFEEVLASANLAACCELFKGMRFHLQDFKREQLRTLVTDYFNSLRNQGEHYIVQFFDKLNSADAIRTMETLRLLGLITSPTHTSRQLSFGVGNANKDLRSIHLTPSIHRNAPNAVAIHPTPESYDFNIQPRTPEDVVLVDNHPEAGNFFDALNKEHAGRVKAINKDAYALLKDIAVDIKNGDMKPRDLLVSLRFDHLMLPDVDKFFKLTDKVIADEADLIMSIGAGHDDDEFRGRLKTMDEIFDCLVGRKLKPVRIKLYRGNSTREKRERPGLGAPQYATYEIIYCKLKKQQA